MRGTLAAVQKLSVTYIPSIFSYVHSSDHMIQAPLLGQRIVSEADALEL